MKKVTMVLIAGLLMSANLSAAPTNGALGKVARIFPSGSGQVYFRIHGDTCNTGNAYYSFDTSEGSATKEAVTKNWYALLLSAAVSSQAVSVRFVGDTDPANCGTAINKPVTYIYIDYPQ